MKLISATIRPCDWGQVRVALCRLGVYDVCLTEVRVPGRSANRAGLYRGAQYIVSHLPHALIEVAVADDMVASVIAAIDLAAGAAAHVQYTVNRLVA